MYRGYYYELEMKIMKYGLFTCRAIMLAKYIIFLKNKYLNYSKIIIQPLKPTSIEQRYFNELNKNFLLPLVENYCSQLNLNLINKKNNLPLIS